LSYSRFGREAEYAAGSCLNNYGWAVFFSKGSRGPADIVASRDNTLLLIQVKSSTKIPKIRGAEIHNLIQMAEKISNSYPLLSLVHPHLECNVNNNSILFGNYLINFFILPRWESVDFIK
jgi:Holliday junction resolvase